MSPNKDVIRISEIHNYAAHVMEEHKWRFLPLGFRAWISMYNFGFRGWAASDVEN
jgi:hypothetical protein